MSKPIIAITLGDPAGIGPEIVAKALRDPRVRRSCKPLWVGDPLSFQSQKLALPRSLSEPVPVLQRPLKPGRIHATAGRAAYEAVCAAVRLLQQGKARALVTAPYSKQALGMSGLPVQGHTELLQDLTSSRRVAMLLAAGKIRVILVTRHLPLRRVPGELTPRALLDCAILGARFLKRFLNILRPRLVACALNPHAGEGGQLGQEEQTLYVKALKAAKRKGVWVEGPAPSDTAFREMIAGHYDLVLAAYHDQALIALKVHAPREIVNITLGLPFVRTSPGHGTAFDIAGRGIADPEPMIRAILWATKLCQNRALASIS